MKIIAIEEHFHTEGYINYLHSRKKVPRREFVEDEDGSKVEREWWIPSNYSVMTPDLKSRILDLGEVRLRAMDESNVDMAVLSLGFPGVEQFNRSDGTSMAKQANDDLFKAIQKYPERFAGFAALAPQDPDAAARELERAVKELGLKGALINSHINGEYLDDQKYWAVFKMAEKLDVPIYIHPKQPSPDMLKPYLAYPGLAHALLGFAAEVSLHALRLMCSGVFDKYPGLKIILGHMGEALPYWFWRMDNMWSRGPLVKKNKKLPSQYFKDNFYVTTSGMFWPPVLKFAISVIGADKILFATDYPYEVTSKAVQFMDTAQISDSDREKIYYLNAERLLGL